MVTARPPRRSRMASSAAAADPAGSASGQISTGPVPDGGSNFFRFPVSPAVTGNASGYGVDNAMASSSHSLIATTQPESMIAFRSNQLQNMYFWCR
ncbi:MAG: hypothetical protein OXE78_11270 [Gammaproteobacteria bacterium]|nr:hypothetical protein [Gammaproteobacteria bacterium]MCY4358544.1 hypothetical protein [Gammaproteobacteria bacterium]